MFRNFNFGSLIVLGEQFFYVLHERHIVAHHVSTMVAIVKFLEVNPRWNAFISPCSVLHIGKRVLLTHENCHWNFVDNSHINLWWVLLSVDMNICCLSVIETFKFVRVDFLSIMWNFSPGGSHRESWLWYESTCLIIVWGRPWVEGLKVVTDSGNRFTKFFLLAGPVFTQKLIDAEF